MSTATGGAIGNTTAALVSPAGPVRSAAGRFGVYGGRYVPETLMAALLELDAAYAEAQADAAFHAELDGLLKDYCGRPTPLYSKARSLPAVFRCAGITTFSPSICAWTTNWVTG